MSERVLAKKYPRIMYDYTIAHIILEANLIFNTSDDYSAVAARTDYKRAETRSKIANISREE